MKEGESNYKNVVIIIVVVCYNVMGSLRKVKYIYSMIDIKEGSYCFSTYVDGESSYRPDPVCNTDLPCEY